MSTFILQVQTVLCRPRFILLDRGALPDDRKLYARPLHGEIHVEGRIYVLDVGLQQRIIRDHAGTGVGRDRIAAEVEGSHMSEDVVLRGEAVADDGVGARLEVDAHAQVHLVPEIVDPVLYVHPVHLPLADVHQVFAAVVGVDGEGRPALPDGADDAALAALGDNVALDAGQGRIDKVGGLLDAARR